MEQLRCVCHAFNPYAKDFTEAPCSHVTKLRAHTSLQDDLGEFNALPAERQSMPRGRTPNSRSRRRPPDFIEHHLANTAMLLCAGLRDGLCKVAFEDLERITVVQNLKGWRRVPRPCSFGVPTTPMTGSRNSRRTSLPTSGQRARTSAWRRRRSRGLPPRLRDYPAGYISPVT